jgi:hypothetical protein
VGGSFILAMLWRGDGGEGKNEIKDIRKAGLVAAEGGSTAR